MNNLVRTGIAVITSLYLAQFAAAQIPPGLGTEEFGLTPKQLVAAVEKVETLISLCMRKQGFEYIANSYHTVRRGMNADKKLPGISEATFITQHGFGVATTYSGKPPQLASGYNPGREGLGDKNIDIYQNLSPADRIAYNRALFGENVNATFATGLEQENFSYTGGCTRKAISQVFTPEQMQASYYNPKDSLINQDPRMKAALRTYADEMHKAGFDYTHPDQVEPDIRKRLAAITHNGSVPLDKLTPSQRAALTALQDFERKVAIKDLQMQEDLIDPIADKIQEELFARKAH